MFASKMRVREAMIAVDPSNHKSRVIDGEKKFNWHKLHVDLCEKLVHYGCLIVGAIDGNVKFFSIQNRLTNLKENPLASLF